MLRSHGSVERSEVVTPGAQDKYALPRFNEKKAQQGAHNFELDRPDRSVGAAHD
jgi:hypothetical protein